jgi:hypothetical protein
MASLLLLAFLLSDSGGLTAVDIHDVPIVPAAVVISYVNRSPAYTVARFTTKSILAKSIGFPSPHGKISIICEFFCEREGGQASAGVYVMNIFL